jgi:hypothetical protein
MLRLQNKYRNTLKKEPGRIAEIAAELGLDEEVERLKRTEKSTVGQSTRLPERDFLRRRLESEINALYDRLAQALKTENERLRAENEMLKEQLQNS